MNKFIVTLALIGAVCCTGTSSLFAQKPDVPVDPDQDTPAKLIAVLQSDASQKDKADACRKLAVVGTGEAVPALAALLKDEKLSHMARYALEPIPDPAADEALRQALGQVKGRLLAGVIASLGVRRDARAVAPITPLLKNADAIVAQAAARALGSIATLEASKALLQALPQVPAGNQLALCEGLFRCAETMIAKGQRRPAIAIYDRLRALPKPHQVRAGGLRGAILARQQDGLDLLKESLRSQDFILFAAAVRTALEMTGPEVTQALIGGLGGASSDQQILILQTLAKRGDAAALPIFQRIARAGSLAQPVRLAAVRCLIELGPASAAPILLGLLKEDDRDIARAAQEGLAALPGKEIDTLVLRLLGSAEAGQRLLALELIGQRRMKKALPALIEKLNDTDNSVRSAALKGLGELGTTAELPMLLDRLLDTRSSQDLKALEQAVSTLCAKSDNPEQSTGKLAGLLNRASPAQKIVLLRVLAQAGGPTALAAIRASVKDADPEVHAAAIRTLSTWKTTEVIPDLLALAKEAKDPTDRQLGLRSYLGLATRTTIPPAERLSMCKQASTLVKNPEDKKLLLAALGGLNSPGALPLILPHLEDPATNEEAAAAAVVLAERLLKGRDRPRVASQLIGPLEKVAKATTNADLARRAQEAAKLAKSKAGVK